MRSYGCREPVCKPLANLRADGGSRTAFHASSSTISSSASTRHLSPCRPRCHRAGAPGGDRTALGRWSGPLARRDVACLGTVGGRPPGLRPLPGAVPARRGMSLPRRGGPPASRAIRRGGPAVQTGRQPGVRVSAGPGWPRRDDIRSWSARREPSIVRGVSRRRERRAGRGAWPRPARRRGGRSQRGDRALRSRHRAFS